MPVLAAARVVTGAEVLAPGWLSYMGGRIAGVGPGRPDDIDVDLGDATLVPGFVDLHVHGGGGGSFPAVDPESALRAVNAHRQHGTTTTMASLVTAGPAELLSAVSMLAELHRDGLIAGIHLEGPWISAQRCGAHDPRQLRDPDKAEITRLLAAGGDAIAMVTTAPELDGAHKAIRRFADAGVLPAVGHTNCSYRDALRAIDGGARVATSVQRHPADPPPKPRADPGAAR